GITRNFRDLDTSISKVSQTAVNIGDQLERVEQQRESIITTKDLIDHFMKFNTDNRLKIDPMFSATSGAKLYEASDLILQLKAIASEMTSRDVNKAKHMILETSESIKKCLKDVFVKALPSGDTETMRECAKRLELFYRDSQSFSSTTTAVAGTSVGNSPSEQTINETSSKDEMKTPDDTWEKTLDGFLTEFLRSQIDW
ncbi:hypothetical protein RFI_19973, partial [Reticulomyxa filosa]